MWFTVVPKSRFYTPQYLTSVHFCFMQKETSCAERVMVERMFCNEEKVKLEQDKLLVAQGESEFSKFLRSLMEWPGQKLITC